MHSIVTGGTGFLGSNLCKKLIKNGHKVTCIGNNYAGTLENIKNLLGNHDVKFIEHNIINPISIEEKIDYIYNFACPASPIHHQGKAAIMTTKTCVIGVLNMLELAKKLMKHHKILDLRNILDGNKAKELGFEYRGIGR